MATCVSNIHYDIVPTPSNTALLTKQYAIREKISPDCLIYLPKSAIIWEKKRKAWENEVI